LLALIFKLQLFQAFATAFADLLAAFAAAQLLADHHRTGAAGIN